MTLDVDIKVVRLSDNKVRLDYKAPLICAENTIKTIDLKIRYRLDKNGVYSMIYPKPAFLDKISNAYRVKKKFIHYGSIISPYVQWRSNQLNQHIEIDGLKFDNFIKSLYITDENWYKNWNRDSKILNILSVKEK